MSVPSPWIALLLAAASFRIWRLLSEDTILDVPRRKVVNLPLTWEEGMQIPDKYRGRLAEFINCPWCLGFWVSISIWGLWQIDHHWVEVAATPFAISAAVGVIRTKLDPE